MSVRLVARLVIVLVVSVSAPALADAPDSAASTPTDMSASQAAQVLKKNRSRAKAGDASAQYNMGVLYDRGLGVDQDYAEARRWYEKAAEQRYGRAEHNLGIMYESGKGVKPDMAQAAQWFRRGADDGQAASQNNLGVLYMQGKGVIQNTGKAAFWTARAAAAGNGAAIDNLPRIVRDLPEAHVNADDVNVRDQPDGNARVVRQVDSDAAVVVLSREADWTQILFPKSYETGWVANFLLSDSLSPLAGDTEAPNTPSAADNGTPESAPVARTTGTANTPTADDDTAATSSKSTRPDRDADTAGSDSKRQHIGADTVNLRAGPSRSAKIIGQLHRDDTVSVRTRRNGWAQVSTAQGTTGWLAGYLLVAG